MLLEQFDRCADLAGGVAVQLPQPARPICELGSDFDFPRPELIVASARILV
jgi:hypothetical protein